MAFYENVTASMQAETTVVQAETTEVPVSKVGIPLGIPIPTPIDVQYYVVELIIAVVATLGNILVIYVVLGRRRGRHRGHISNFYIVSLAVADVCIGMFVGPFALLNSIGLPRNYELCISMQCVLLTFCASSIYSCVIVSVDRYIAVAKSHLYTQIMTRFRAKVLVAGAWILAIIIGFIPVFGWNLGRPPVERCFFVEIINFHYLAFFFFFVVVPSSLIITILYILIFNAIRKQLNKMASNTCASQYADKVAPPGDDANKKSMGGRRWRKEVQIAKVLFMIIVFFFASWYPLFTANFVSAFFYMVPFPTVRVLIYISHANSAINPFLYGIASQEFRSEYGRVFARIFCCRAAQEVAVEVSSTSGQQTKPPQSLSVE